ncbi:polysaccharide pyruvyl transferase family protein [Helicobacter sp. 23-1045]
MKKVRIVTFCDTLCNYGQVLQAFALQRFLRDNYKDFEVKVFYVNIYNANQATQSTKRHFWTIACERLNTLRRYFNAYVLCLDKYDKKIRRNKIETIKTALREVLQESGIFNDFGYWARVNMLDKKRGFEEFKREFIALHSESLQDFRGFAPEYDADCYIVGSDQVWNTDLTNIMDFYTLEFLPQNHKSRKISYAASIGKPKFGSDGEKAYFKNALSKFDAISLRESCNIATLKEIGLQSVCVPDPSQLLTKNDYEKLIDSSIKNGEFDSRISDGKIRKDSIFIYWLGTSHINMIKFANSLKTKNKLICVDLAHQIDLDSDFAPTPQEWLACVRDAKMLITDSFHGCAYAIVMNTPFVALKLGKERDGRNTRFYHLLELFGLQNRLVDNLSDLRTQIKTPIDFESVNQKLDSWRNVGIEFLERNLKDL